MAALHQKILQRLAESRNAAVERVAGDALEGATGQEQAVLVNTLIKRNKRPGWIAMIRQFDCLSLELQDQLLQHPKELFGPLSEAIGDHDGSGRTNVIEIIRKASDPRLVLLLIEALSDAREDVRQLAARSFVDAVMSYNGGIEAKTAETPPDPVRLRRAVEFALGQFKAHRQTDIVLAALLFERVQDGTLWPLLADMHDEVGRIAQNTLRALTHPGLAPAAILALTTPLKNAALAGLGAIEKPEILSRIAEESFRLIDPVVRVAAATITHCRALDVVPADAPWGDSNWVAWFRLVDGLGLPAFIKYGWFQLMLATAPVGEAGVPRKLVLLGAIGRLEVSEATGAITAFLTDPDRRVTRSAKRILLLRKHKERRPEQSGQAQRAGPPVGTAASLRRAVGGAPAPGQFARVWDEFSQLPPAVQTTASRTLSETDDKFAELLRSKLTSNNVPEMAQGLRMLTSIQNIAPFREQIIALCGHGDARLVATAVKLLGRLEDPKLGNLLEAAARHGDPRVRANAVESMEDLHIADRSTQLLVMLHSRHNRERANAIKAISTFDFLTARDCLVRMLNDNNAHHRMSALWVVGQLGMLDIVRQVASCARLDDNPRVRKLSREMLNQLNEAASIQAAKA